LMPRIRPESAKVRELALHSRECKGARGGKHTATLYTAKYSAAIRENGACAPCHVMDTRARCSGRKTASCIAQRHSVTLNTACHEHSAPLCLWTQGRAVSRGVARTPLRACTTVLADGVCVSPTVFVFSFFVFVRVRAYACVCACGRVYVRVYVDAPVCKCACACVHVYVCIWMPMCMCAYVPVRARVNLCMARGLMYVRAILTCPPAAAAAQNQNAAPHDHSSLSLSFMVCCIADDIRIKSYTISIMIY
jgi:hypothetical protein